MNDEWRKIPGWNYYEVNKDGIVRSLDRVIKTPKYTRRKPGRLMKGKLDQHGYLTYQLKENNKRKLMKAHRAVALAFIPNPENKPCVNHIDCNIHNNNVSNLEWCTHKENMDWMHQTGRAKRTKQWLDRLHETQRKTMYKAVVGTNIQTGEIIRFESVNSTAKAGFKPSCVSNCCNGKVSQHKGYRWKHEKTS